MVKTIAAKTRAEAIERMGHDWYKIVKVEGGYKFFEYANDYTIWKNS